MTQPKQDSEETATTSDQNVFTQAVSADFKTYSSRAKLKLQGLMSDKLWRIEVQQQINAFVKGENRNLKETMNIKESKKDGKLFQLSRRNVLEEDVFKYFYPFCLFNCTVGVGIALRKCSLPIILLGGTCTIEYVFWLFNFPVESWHFHMRAISDSKPYAQFLRDSYILRFPESNKASVYRQINDRETQKYSKLRQKLDVPSDERPQTQ